MAMKLIKKTAEYKIFMRGDDRYAVRDASGKPVNGEEKVRILVEEDLIKVTLPKPKEEVADSEDAADGGDPELEPEAEDVPEEVAPEAEPDPEADSEEAEEESEEKDKCRGANGNRTKKPANAGFFVHRPLKALHWLSPLNPNPNQ